MTSSVHETEQKSIRFIRGIGPKRLEAFQRIGINTIRDLCYFFPRRHEDRSKITPIGEIQSGTDVTIHAKVLAASLRPLKQLTLFELKVGDETGMLSAVWFNQPYLKSQFKVGEEFAFSGKAELFQGKLQLSSPEYERLDGKTEETVQTGRITPVYPLTEGLAQRATRIAMKEVVDHYAAKEIHEFLPEPIRKKYAFLDLLTAVRTMHFPNDLPEISEARRRLVFDEFFIFQLLLLSKIKAAERKERGIPLQGSEKWLAEFRAHLPFSLTRDQEKAIREITQSVSKEIPMNRLLQGEVGSGKTVVAAFLLFLAAKNGLQGAFLVPTEILAEQHAQKLTPLFGSLGIQAQLLTGSSEPQERERILKGAESGAISILIGTHALLQEDVTFQKLGIVVIDEQHRFGVRQRAKLILRNPRPHLLVMTATPIPRTLGLSMYGDFDISTIRELPKGRREIKTIWAHPEEEPKILETIRSQVLQTGDQSFIIFPLIDETEKIDLQAAAQEYEKLRRGIFKDVPIGLLHGRMLKKDRDEVMGRFSRGQLKVLVTTSVIEVGVDQPNATILVIEHAERFGLSQMHQMRGRIGRGNKNSVCYLFGTPTTEEGKKRLEILTQTNDGFSIAEHDLVLRGPGDFFGTRQSGIPVFHLANLIADEQMLLSAREEARALIDSDPALTHPVHQGLGEELRMRRTQFLFS